MAYGDCGATKRYRPGEQPLVDRFSFGHAAVGVLYGATGVPWWGAAVAAVTWEVIEDPLKERLPAVFPDACYDTVENAVADALFVMAGYWVARAIVRRTT
jgi:hypothetical protein